MKKYPRLRYTNHKKSEPLFERGEIVVQEKIDGANMRFALEELLDEQFHTENRDIVFGSRNVIYKNQKDESKQFSAPINYIRDTVSYDDIIRAEDIFAGRLTFFGEAMLPHTLSYNFDDSPAFVGFDVYNHSTEQWLTQKNIDKCFDILGLEQTPVLDTIPAREFDEYDVTVPTSAYGDVQSEGLAFKNYETQTFAKFVRPEFKEKHGQTFGKPKKHQESGAEKLSYQYITRARIEKNAYKMIDEGPWDCLQMEMMAPKQGHDGLPQAVIRDMAEEEGAAIFLKENWDVDISEFRSTVSSRCAQVLKKMIAEKST